MNNFIKEKVIRRKLAEIILKIGLPALSLYSDHLHINFWPSKKFIFGGPQGDNGFIGRKIIIDTYGGWGAQVTGRKIIIDTYGGWGAQVELDRSAISADRWPSLW